VFVTALTIVDDIIAVLVISLFYTEKIEVFSLIAGLAVPTNNSGVCPMHPPPFLAAPQSVLLFPSASRERESG
jgi:hypothetical protein